MRHIETFSSAVILAKMSLFDPLRPGEQDVPTQLAFFGRDYSGRIAVLDGPLAEPQYRAQRMGLVVVRERIGDPNAYVDRAPLDCTLRSESGGRKLWLTHHGGNTDEGILEINIGNAAFNGYDITPSEPPDTLAINGLAIAYANTPIEAMMANTAKQAAVPTAANA
jgi:hypothetical protein